MGQRLSTGGEVGNIRSGAAKLAEKVNARELQQECGAGIGAAPAERARNGQSQRTRRSHLIHRPLPYSSLPSISSQLLSECTSVHIKNMNHIRTYVYMYCTLVLYIIIK